MFRHHLKNNCYLCGGIETIKLKEDMVGCLVYLIMYVFIVGILLCITPWWDVLLMHIVAVVFLLIYKGDAIFRGRYTEKQKGEHDDDANRAAREERDAYDDFIASMDK